jgi:hypothetical protein
VALELERLWNELTRGLPFFTICAYPINCFEHSEARNLLRNVWAEHSAVSIRSFAQCSRDMN